MSKIAPQLINQQLTGMVPAKKKHLKRYPFIFLIDISGSTGTGTDPDINHINRAIADLTDQLRNPAPSSPIASTVDQIDICIITYSNTPTIEVPWSTAPALPASIPPFAAGGCTNTGLALETAMAQIGARLNYYKDPANNISSAMPHIIHLSDGYPTDMQPGDPQWNALQDKLSNIDGNKNVEKKYANILHFVAPNGCMSNSATGVPSGQDVLAQLSGKGAVYDMAKEVGNFSQLVVTVTVIISKITQNFSTTAAADAGIKTTKKTLITEDV